MIATRPFGNTGHQSSRVIFGAAGLSQVSQADADRAIEWLLAAGVNHIDTAASYGDSERLLGPAMRRHREQFFLATKTGERTRQAARDEIHRSLERLCTDRIDLLQLHNLVDEQEWQTALGPGGALEAAIEARDAGLVRFIGVTGHGLSVAGQHRRALQRFAFDSVLLPYSYILMQHPGYAADFSALAAVCAERGVAMQTIKSITRAPWSERPVNAPTWYEPLRAPADIDRAVHWVLGHPQAFLNSAGDLSLLPLVLDAAARADARPSDAEMDAMLAERAMAPLFT
jgi:aryl-alcohol dehydrogenase-like predicted oxidoreductase